MYVHMCIPIISIPHYFKFRACCTVSHYALYTSGSSDVGFDISPLQCEAVRDVMVRLLGSDDSDCWILNTAFIVDDFSFVESLTVCLLDRIP